MRQIAGMPLMTVCIEPEKWTEARWVDREGAQRSYMRQGGLTLVERRHFCAIHPWVTKNDRLRVIRNDSGEVTEIPE